MRILHKTTAPTKNGKRKTTETTSSETRPKTPSKKTKPGSAESEQQSDDSIVSTEHQTKIGKKKPDVKVEESSPSESEVKKEKEVMEDHMEGLSEYEIFRQRCVNTVIFCFILLFSCLCGLGLWLCMRNGFS
jgi:hypothetical protein